MQIVAELGLAPTRAAGLARLAGFAPRAGRAYAAGRNADLAGHPHVSGLSAYVRHRLVLESEIVAAAQALHGPAAQKFVAEVLWRTYWKGWMELRPGVWQAYRHGVRAALDRVAVEEVLRRDWQAACTGATGIDCMDHWSRELVSTGYLHNHARMWFASIWVFTLRLPWQLGADFFLRHLTDGDPAANTLSWRWVAGLHTPGKTYLATADNIARHTDGRFRPEGLAKAAAPLPMDDVPPPRAAPRGGVPDAGQPAALLLHEDDLGAEFLLDRGLAPVATAVMTAPEGRSPLVVAPHVAAFATGAAEDATRRLAAHLGPATVRPDDAVAWAEACGVRQVVAPWAPAGPVADRLADIERALAARGIRLVRVLRRWDADLWPHATHGFFRFHEKALQWLAAER